jgi:hypothetical protein
VEHVDGYKRIRNPFLGEVEFKLKPKQQKEANNSKRMGLKRTFHVRRTAEVDVPIQRNISQMRRRLG